jgi:PAS domain S-box-containing protein
MFSFMASFSRSQKEGKTSFRAKQEAYFSSFIRGVLMNASKNRDGVIPYKAVLFPFHEQYELPLSEQANTSVCPDIHSFSFHFLMESMPHLVWMITPDGQVTYVNHQLMEYTGLAIEDMQHGGWLDCIHPDDRERSLETWLQNTQSEQRYQIEHRLRRASDGGYRWYLIHALPLKDQADHIFAWMGTCTDIHAQKQAQDDTTQRKHFYQRLADALPHGIWIARPDGQTTFRNHYWSQYTGLPPSAQEAEQWLRVVHPDDRCEELRCWRESVQTQKPYENISRVRRAADGAYRWHLARVVPIHDQQGQCLAWLGSCTDIEDWKQMEVALRQSEQAFRLLASALPQLIWRTDANGRFDYCNEQWTTYTGLALKQTQDQGWLQCIHPDDWAQSRGAWEQTLATGSAYEGAYRLRRISDGTYRWHLTRAVALRDENGTLLAWLGSCTDIEEQKRSQEAMQRLLMSEQGAHAQSEQTNQMLRNFMSILGHEFRTALTGIQGFSELLCHVTYPEEVREFASDIQADALRLHRMVTDLLDLEKMQAGRMTLYLETVDLSALIEQVVARQVLVASTHHVHLHLEAHLPQLVADRDKLIQVLTNLLTNAVKYAPDCPDIDLGSVREENDVHIWVRDGGPGIPADALETIFLPYHRVQTQQSHSITGTGLGLPIVRKIIELHGGRVWVESALGNGSTFHFTLPCI